MTKEIDSVARVSFDGIVADSGSWFVPSKKFTM